MAEKHEADEMDETNEHSNSINRRRFVKSIGLGTAATAFSTGIGAANAATSALFGDQTHLPISQERLTGHEETEVIQTAYRSTVVETVASELPRGKNSLDTDEAEAYEIWHKKQEKTLRKVAFSVEKADNSLNFAADTEKQVAGVKTGNDRTAYAKSNSDGNTGLLHRSPASDSIQKQSLQTIKSSSEYSQITKNLANKYHIQTQKAIASYVEETATSYVVIPLEPKQDAKEALLAAEVDLTTDTVVVAQTSFADCVVNCLATFAGFYGICAPSCSVCASVPIIYNPACYSCAACLGVPLSTCTISCV